MASSYLDLIFRTKKEGTASTDVTKDLANMKREGGGLGDAFEMLTGSSLGAAGAFGLVASGLKFAVGSAMEAEKIQADLNATLQSTKGAAGLSADEINRMASELSQMTGIEDDSIVSAQAMLLTFTNIGKDVFPAASQAMLNMSTKFGGLESASVQLGKALNDPVAGATALRRVGVALTDAQEKQIKAFVELGDVASAQKVILAELETEFGGLAVAMGGTTEGTINKLKNSLGNLAETVGGKLAPFLQSAAEALNVLLTANEKSTQVLEDHNKEVTQTSKNYDEYVKEMTRAKYAQLGHTDALTLANVAVEELGGDMDLLAESVGAATRAEYDQARATKTAEDAAFAYAAVLGDFVLKNNAGIGSVKTLGESLANVVEEQKASELAGQLAEITGAMTEMTAAALYQKVIIGMDAESALALGLSMGVVSEKTYVANQAIKQWQADLASGTISQERYNFLVENLANNWDKLDSKTIKLTVDIYDPGGVISGGGGTKNKVYAAGGSFVIPPGYENETFPLGPGRRASSGETVTVTPRGQSGPSGGGGLPTMNITINSPMDLESFKRMLMQVAG